VLKSGSYPLLDNFALFPQTRNAKEAREFKETGNAVCWLLVAFGN
jgi:hypothetical protein